MSGCPLLDGRWTRGVSDEGQKAWLMLGIRGIYLLFCELNEIGSILFVTMCWHMCVIQFLLLEYILCWAYVIMFWRVRSCENRQ